MNPLMSNSKEGIKALNPQTDSVSDMLQTQARDTVREIMLTAQIFIGYRITHKILSISADQLIMTEILTRVIV